MAWPGTAPAAVAALLLAALLVAACGAERDNGGEIPAETVPERSDGEQPRRERERDRDPDRERPEQRDAEQPPPEGEPGPGGAPGAIVGACRRVVRNAPGLSERKRRELIRDCEGAATGDEETLRRAAGAACDAIATATVPWPLRGQAAEACRRAIPSGDPSGGSL